MAAAKVGDASTPDLRQPAVEMKAAAVTETDVLAGDDAQATSDSDAYRFISMDILTARKVLERMAQSKPAVTSCKDIAQIIRNPSPHKRITSYTSIIDGKTYYAASLEGLPEAERALVRPATKVSNDWRVIYDKSIEVLTAQINDFIQKIADQDYSNKKSYFKQVGARLDSLIDWLKTSCPDAAVKEKNLAWLSAEASDVDEGEGDVHQMRMRDLIKAQVALSQVGSCLGSVDPSSVAPALAGLEKMPHWLAMPKAKRAASCSLSSRKCMLEQLKLKVEALKERGLACERVLAGKALLPEGRSSERFSISIRTLSQKIVQNYPDIADRRLKHLVEQVYCHEDACDPRDGYKDKRNRQRQSDMRAQNVMAAVDGMLIIFTIMNDNRQALQDSAKKFDQEKDIDKAEWLAALVQEDIYRQQWQFFDKNFALAQVEPAVIDQLIEMRDPAYGNGQGYL